MFHILEDQLRSATENLDEAGLGLIHQNPYWADTGAVVCRDPDGYLVVLCPHSN